MTVSPKRHSSTSKETQKTVRSTKRDRLKRPLNVETLEKRELLAADVAAFQNNIFAYDVDGDFMVSPLDVLTVVNDLNANGTRSLSGLSFDASQDSYVDVDGDNYVTPLDVLGLINILNTGEGEDRSPKLVEVKYEYYRVNADGTVGELIPDANPATAEPDAVIGVGEQIIVRTTMKDLRTPATTGGRPGGIFSAYHDLTVTNADGATEERLELQWSEYYRLQFNDFLTGGSITLGWGDKTATITPVIESGFLMPEPTMALVQTAMNSLFGEDQVRVRSYQPANSSEALTDADYEIHFYGELARQRLVPEIRIVSQNLTTIGSDPAYSLARPAALDPINDSVAAAAINHNINNDWASGSGGPAGGAAVLRYTNGPTGSYLPADGATRTLRRLGGFSNILGAQTIAVATSYLGVVDTLFEGGSEGLVRLEGKLTPITTGASGDNLGIALFDTTTGNSTNSYLGTDQVIWPTGTVQIVSHLSAAPDSYTFQEDLNGITPAVVSLDVIANDVSRNSTGGFGPASEMGTTITAIAGLDAAFGTATIVAATNRIEFRPAANVHGQEVFTYSIRNSLGDTAVGTVTINLTAVNDPPIAIKTSFSAIENTPGLTIPASEIFVPGPADEQSETPPQTVSITAARTVATSNGTVSVVSGQVRYVPTANFNGTAHIVVDAQDNLGAQISNVTLTITVESTNDAPIVVNSNFTTAEDTAITIQPTEIFSPGPPDEAAQTVTLSILAPPATGTGTATVNAQGRLVVTPAANYFGNIVLEVRGTDNGLSPANLTRDTLVTITVTPVNDAPVATNDSFTIPGIGGTTILPVMGNDRPGPANETEAITVISVTAPTIGVATVVDGQVQYVVPSDSSNFGKTTTFSYTIRDAGGLTATATATISIVAPASPYAIDDDYRSNTTLRVSESSTGATYSFDVIDNDYSELPAPITLAGTPTLVSGEGTLGRNGNLVTYTPPNGYAGEVVFTYEVEQDGGEVDGRYVATATILVAAVNDPPVAVEVTRSTPEDTAITIDAMSLGLSSGPGETDQLRFTTASLVTASHGTVQIVDGKVVFTPAANFFGEARIRYVVTDDGEPNLASNQSTLIINVTPVNDAPVAGADQVRVAEDNVLTIPVSTLLANDNPGPGENAQTLTIVPVTGTVPTANGSIRHSTQDGAPVIIYTPNANFHGTDTFTYQLSDGQSTNSTATGTVTVTVTEVNDAPVATQISKSAFAGVPITYDLTAELAGMSRGAANESAQTLRIVSVTPTAGTKGTIVLNANGTVTYTAPANATPGEDSFSFTVRDNGTTNGQADPKEATGTFKVTIAAFQPSSITGVVYIDDNANGKLDGTELRVSGADVILTIAADPTVPNSVAQTVKSVTLADGSYTFDTLPPGSYTVEYIVPSLAVDAPGANSYTKVITAPGGTNEQVNFAISGVSPRYANIIENLASSYYMRNPALAINGLYATLKADGTSDWTSARGDFGSDKFHEVVLSSDGSRAIVTAVRGADNGVYTAVLTKNQFIKTTDATTGVTLLRVMATSSELSWQRVDLATKASDISATGYLVAVDELFASQDW